VRLSLRRSIPEPDGTGVLSLDLEAVAPPPNLPIRVGVFLSQALAPLQGFTGGSVAKRRTPPQGLLPERDPDLAPSEVTVPYRVFPVWGSAITSRFPGRAASRATTEVWAQRLRPQGFAPSRRFAPPQTCRACSIPVPRLGFTLRGLAPR
jgi:hypothetical protein